MANKLGSIIASQVLLDFRLLKPQKLCVVPSCHIISDHRLTTLGDGKVRDKRVLDKTFIQTFPKRLKKKWSDMWTLKPFATHGDFDYFCKFNDSDTIDSWIVSTDADTGVGKSRAYFTQSKNNKGLFYGYLNTEPLKDGLTTSTGFCQIKCPLNLGLFGKPEPYDWSQYTHLVMRIRGDGRPYYLNIHMDEYLDIMFNDQYNYTLFTRGGPYWQIAKIPFSKFYLTSEGRIQDKQIRMNQSFIRFFGITICDNIDGPFQLEIDYIALIFDGNHSEYFPYETYSQS